MEHVYKIVVNIIIKMKKRKFALNVMRRVRIYTFKIINVYKNVKIIMS